MAHAQEQAVADLVELIDLYPDDTVFFLNAWTHGYEDMLKGVYRAYGEKVACMQVRGEFPARH